MDFKIATGKIPTLYKLLVSFKGCLQDIKSQVKQESHGDNGARGQDESFYPIIPDRPVRSNNLIRQGMTRAKKREFAKSG